MFTFESITFKQMEWENNSEILVFLFRVFLCFSYTHIKHIVHIRNDIAADERTTINTKSMCIAAIITPFWHNSRLWCAYIWTKQDHI